MAATRPAASRARRRCATCGASVRAKDRFCGTCGTPLEAVLSASPPQESASLQVSGIEPAALGEQRKVVTILFGDLSGSTALGERLDPEELRGILTSYFNELARQIQRYEGTVDKYIGDAVMAVFGAPISHEDDAERAINAALAMQSSIRQLNDGLERRHGIRLTLRIGINTGEVVAGLLATEVQRAYTVVGDAVNTAQRYEAAAPPGEILVSATTRRLAIHSFEFEETAPLTLKGKAERVVAYRVLRRRYEEIAPESSLFIGREPELELLRAAVTDAVEGRGRILSIVGEAGVGKSRLVGELRAGLVAGIDRITVRCASFEANTPYALIADFVRGAFSIRAADDEATARAAIANGFEILGQPIDETSVLLLLDVLGYGERSTFDPEVKRRVLVTLLRTLLRLAGARTPFVLTAEDMHWVDGASLRVLGELVPGLRALPAVFITTARPGWTPPWEADPVELRALDDLEVRALIESVFEVPVEEQLAQTIVDRTGGNPFFIEEVLRELQASNLLVERLGRVAMRGDAIARVPETVQEVIEARLDRLPPATRRVLNPAAVCGRTFWTRVLERLVPDLPVGEHLATLERESFITLRAVAPEVTYAFRQILIQEVAYETQLQSVRRRTHGQVAAAVEALYAERLDEFVDFLAYHYSRSDDAAKAVGYLLRAGARAQRLYANEEALRSYEEALRLAQSETERSSALEGLGDVLRFLGRYEDALARFEAARVATGTGDALRTGRLLRKIGAVQQLRGSREDAERAFAEALVALPSGEGRERAFALLELGQLRWQQGRYDDAVSTLRDALRDADAVNAPDARAEVLKLLGTVHVVKGDIAEGLRFYEQSLTIEERLGDVFGQANVLNNIGIAYRRDGRYVEALAAYARTLSIRERIGDPWGIGAAHNNIAQILRARGELAAAEDDYRKSLGLWESIGYALGVAIASAGLGITLVERGRRAEGRELLLAALGEWERLGTRSYVSESERFVAQSFLPDDPVLARTWAERALATALELHAADQEGLALQVLGSVHAASGDAESAIRSLERSRQLLQAVTERQELGRTLAALGRLYGALPRSDGRRGEAVALLEEARRIFTGLGAMRDLAALGPERSAVPSAG